MNDVLLRLYAGELRPDEECVCQTEAYKETLNKIRTMQKALMQQMDDGMKAEFARYNEMYNALMGIECEHAYLSGMRLGAQLVRELFEIEV